LLVRGFDPANKTHLALAACNVFSIWYAVVLSIGLSKLGRCRLGAALLLVCVPWVILRLGLIGIGLGGTGWK
jgi:hypothetical protein